MSLSIHLLRMCVSVCGWDDRRRTKFGVGVGAKWPTLETVIALKVSWLWQMRVNIKTGHQLFFSFFICSGPKVAWEAVSFDLWYVLEYILTLKWPEGLFLYTTAPWNVATTEDSGTFKNSYWRWRKNTAKTPYILILEAGLRADMMWKWFGCCLGVGRHRRRMTNDLQLYRILARCWSSVYGQQGAPQSNR